jgi:enterobacteria phage integrase
MFGRAHGHRSVSGLNREHLIKILAPYQDRPGTANNMLKVLKVIIRHAFDLGWLKFDPTIGMKRMKLGRIRGWTDAELEAFERRWPIGTMQGTAFALMLYTSQRGLSDVRCMMWSDIQGDIIKVTQQKTKTTLEIVLHTKLQEVLAGIERSDGTIILNAYGKPFARNSFSEWLRTAMNEAGLPPDCQPHGLRVSAATLLAESAATAHEIMSVTGHKSLTLVQKYTMEAEQKKLSRAAIKKLERN